MQILTKLASIVFFHLSANLYEDYAHDVEICGFQTLHIIASFSIKVCHNFFTFVLINQ